MFKFNKEQQKSIIHWANNPWKYGNTYKSKDVDIPEEAKTKGWWKKLQCEETIKERNWGNKLINATNNGNWTTIVGEGIVHDVLKMKGKNPRRPEMKNGFRPDWETDDEIIEVKTRTWCVSGTAGDRAGFAFYKYCDIPKIYNKPLKIICIAYQEWEFTNSNTKMFDPKSENQKKFLKLALECGVEFVKFSDFTKDIQL